MISIILTTLLSLQISAPPKAKDMYKFEFQQFGKNEGYVQFSVIPQPGFKWGELYDSTLTLKDNKNLTLPKRSFSRLNKDFVQKGKNGVVKIPFSLKSKKKQVVEGVTNFLICCERFCKPFRNIKIKFNIDVK